MALYDYDVAVVGGGAAGLTAAGFCANLGAKTALVSDEVLGGDCTWVGCVPSKSLLAAAHAAHVARHGGTYGLQSTAPGVDFGRVMEIVRDTRREVYHDADDPALFESFGVDVKRGKARFVDAHTLEVVADHEADYGIETTRGWSGRLSARFVILCTGGRPAAPPIDGLGSVAYHTNRTLFEITEQPARMVVVGAGPIGMEMGQAFNRLGTAVTIVDHGDQVLSRDDPDHAAVLQEAVAAEGVTFLMGASVDRVESAGEGVTRVHVTPAGGAEQALECEALLIAAGRKPNVEGLGLEAAGVETDERGIAINSKGQTSQTHIYAAGDCTGRFQLTHMSEHSARVAATNIMTKWPSRLDTERMPWVTFTDPEVAHLGASQAELDEAGTDYEVYRFPYTKVDRAIAEHRTTGEIKVFATKWRGTILGASVVGARAGELITTYAVAMKNGVGLGDIADTIIPYPTYGLGARRAADQWYVRKQYPILVKAIKKLFGFRGTVPPPPDPDRIV